MERPWYFVQGCTLDLDGSAQEDGATRKVKDPMFSPRRGDEHEAPDKSTCTGLSRSHLCEIYSASRFKGFLIQRIFCSLLWDIGRTRQRSSRTRGYSREFFQNRIEHGEADGRRAC